MLWPQAINIRMDPFEVMQLLSALAKIGAEQFVIDDYPEYGEELDASQQAILRKAAEAIVQSQSTENPITAVAVIGHADHARRVPIHEKAAKEEAVSRGRAKNARQMLRKLLEDMSVHDANLRGRLSMVHIEPFWEGSKFATYADMRKNRRVVFKWARSFSPKIIHPPIPIPPQPAPNPDDDPNVVYAGQKFRMKILQSVSGAIGVGAASATVVIWDVGNSRAAAYEYVAAMVGAGGGYDGGESNWCDFEREKPIQVDQFAGSGGHITGSVGLVSYTELTITHLRPQVNCRFLGIFSKSFGAEGTPFTGAFRLIPGTVNVFKGP